MTAIYFKGSSGFYPISSFVLLIGSSSNNEFSHETSTGLQCSHQTCPTGCLTHSIWLHSQSSTHGYFSFPFHEFCSIALQELKFVCSSWNVVVSPCPSSMLAKASDAVRFLSASSTPPWNDEAPLLASFSVVHSKQIHVALVRGARPT